MLSSKYDIPLDNTGKGFSYPVSVIKPNIGLIDIDFGKPICEHDFSDRASDDGYVTLKRSELKSLCDIRTMAGSRHPAARGRTGGSAAERELQEIKSSNSWKIVMKIRKLGDSPFGPFLKKIFYGMLKIRNKFKKKK